MTLGLLAGCAGGPGAGMETRTSAATMDPASVLGFESTAGWTASSGTASATTTRTQGTAAFALKAPVNFTTINSAQLSSTAVSGLLVAGSSVAIDVLVPQEQPNPWYLGAVQLYVTSASRNVFNTYVGQVELTGSRLGAFRTVKFPVPDWVRAQLQAAPFQDLFFTIGLNAPYGATGTYIFDNLRFKKPASAEEVGTGPSADLVSIRIWPVGGAPGTASFTGVVQVPKSFHVKMGSAGTGTTTLELGLGSSVVTTCTYTGAMAGKTYDFTSCTGGFQPGDLVAATSAKLTIQSADTAAGTTKIKAQLALDPLGDEVGAGLLPPIPTWWGDTAEETNEIASAFFQAQLDAPKTEERNVALPVPEFANRKGDGAPVDMLDPNYVPPPLDPPFNREGHMNEGGKFDAYWRFVGSISGEDAGGRHKTHFEAALSGNAVIWGRDIEVAKVETLLETDNGQLTDSGFQNSSATGSLNAYLFSQLLPGGGSRDARTGFNFSIGEPRNYDAPPIPIWIFTIRAGVTAYAGVTASGSFAPDQFAINVTPQASFGAHLEGSADIVVAKGGIDVRVDLLSVKVPFTASGKWVVSTYPTDCAATLTVGINSSLVIASGGGSVNLTARIGVCPACYRDSFRLFGWPSLIEKTYPLVNENPEPYRLPLPGAMCVRPLTMTISRPSPGTHIKAGVPYVLTGSGMRPATPNSGSGGLMIPTTVDPRYFVWSSSGAADTGFGVSGRNPTVTFNGEGPRRITLSAQDEYGQTGETSVDVIIDAITPADGPQPSLYDPTWGEYLDADRPHIFTGNYLGGTEPVTLTWTANGAVIGTGRAPEVYVPSGDVAIRLTATDANGLSNYIEVPVVGYILR